MTVSQIYADEARKTLTTNSIPSLAILRCYVWIRILWPTWELLH